MLRAGTSDTPTTLRIDDCVVVVDSTGCRKWNEFQARIALMQQTKVTKSKKTGVVRGTDSPSFNESFHFKVAQDALDTTAISVLVTVGKKADNVVGRVQLGSFMFSRGKALDHWNLMLSQPRQHVKQWHTLT